MGVSIHAPAKGRHPWWPCLPYPQTFQSTPPRRGDTSVRTYGERRCCFNPRPREGATLTRGINRRPHLRFQSTPPRRGDRDAAAPNCPGNRFNPRPREGATSAARPPDSFPGCFNPRPREGATWCGTSYADINSVSIHAPAKGRRVTEEALDDMLRFQSTPPRRGDRRRSAQAAPAKVVSIHAPAKGRREPAVAAGDLVRFQSTPPRRGDPAAASTSTYAKGFNPRPREGATSSHAGFRSPFRVSIHAPAKGRPLCVETFGVCLMFQSTPPRRGDVGSICSFV